MQDLYKEINENYEKLSEAEQEVIDFILKFEEIEKIRLKDIRDHLFVSNSTVIRACKKLNYSTFNELKFAFIHTKEEKLNQQPILSSYSSVIETIKKDTLATLDLIDEKEVEYICDCLLKARRIYCVGTGSSSQVAAEFNRKLKLIDLWTNEYSDRFSIERIPQIVHPQDIVIVFSLSGEVEEVNEIMIRAKESQATIIAITNLGSNHLKLISDFSIQVYSSPSNRKKLRSRLMLYVVSALIYEKLITKTPGLE